MTPENIHQLFALDAPADLARILDCQTIQICVEEHFDLARFSFAIVDITGNILVSVGWHDVCGKFHGANPLSCRHCILGDAALPHGIPDGEYRIYKCPNHLYDAVTPISVNGECLGHIVFGQFFLDDDPVDLAQFIAQAKEYGFDENKYIEGINRVPVFSRGYVAGVMGFLSRLAFRLVSISPVRDTAVSQLAESRALVDTLKKSETNYRLLVENQTDLVVKTDMAGNYLYVSPTFCRLFGRREDDIIGKPFRYTIYDEDLSVVSRAEKDIQSPPHTCFYEERAKTTAGWRWIQWSGKAVIGKNGGIRFIVKTGRDITRQKKAEEELLISEAKYSAMVANILDVLMITDENLVVQYVSPNIQKLFGWRPEEVYGQRAFARIDSVYMQRIYDSIIDMIKSNVYSRTKEFKYLTKSGKYISVEITAVNLLHDPNIRGILINYHDITKHKKNEHEIKYLSYQDVMTGLYNRTYYEEELKRLENSNHDLPLSVIIGDVNGLKIINDGFGHAEGDKILKQIAKLLTDCCRRTDIVCRIGGDEFCILLPRTDEIVVQKICNRIYRTCRERNSQNLHLINYSISLGFETKTDTNETLENVIKKAEAFMYRHKLLESRSAHNSLISSIKATMNEKSEETEKHAERLTTLTIALGRQLGLGNEQCNQLELLATLHDLGKMSVDQRILNKQSRLTPPELLEVKKHPETGYRIALASPELVHIANEILCHHERWDGKGYPQGLKGTAIPLLSRIIAVVDTFDAITHDRPYRKARSREIAIDEIKKNSGTQFDPMVVEAFLQLMD